MNEHIQEQEPQILFDDDLEFSPERDKISEALVTAQGLMGDVVKNATNPAFRSKYADLAAVVEAVHPALQKAGMALLQPPAAMYNDTACTVSVTTMLLHKSGQYVRSRLRLRPIKTDPQGVGSAITYGRRYSLQGMCGIAPEDDDGNRASNKDPEPERRPRSTRAAKNDAQQPHEPTIKERLLALLRDDRLTPAEREMAIASVTGQPDPKSIITPELAQMVVANLEKLLREASEEIPA